MIDREIFKKLDEEIPSFIFESVEKIIGYKFPESFKFFISNHKVDEDSIEIKFQYKNGAQGSLLPVFKNNKGQKALIDAFYDPVYLVYNWRTKFDIIDYTETHGIIEIGEGGWSGNGGIYIGIKPDNFGYLYYIDWTNDYGGWHIEPNELKENFIICHNWDSFISGIAYENNNVYNEIKHLL